MTTTLHWTSKDLELLPDDDGKCYEIIHGELYVSRMPNVYHQHVFGRLYQHLSEWNSRTGAGFVILAPGVIFSEDNDVAPDLVWISRSRFEAILDSAGHLQGPPELVVEVLSPGPTNKRRDREI